MSGKSRTIREHDRSAQRLTQVCREIGRGNRPSTRDLAELLEVSERTIKRIIEYLRNELQAPIYADRKNGGYVFTEPHWRIPSLTLEEADLLAFFVAENGLRLTGQVALAKRMRRSLAKVASMLPNHVSADLALFHEIVSFENNPYATVDPGILERVAEAAVAQRTVEFNYFSPHSKSSSKRTADVHLLHNFAGDWFAVSWDHNREDFRDFHIGRMSDFRFSNHYFERRTGFDPDEYLKRGFSMTRGGRLTQVEIEFDAYQSQWIRERHHFHRDETREELPDGGLRLSFKVGSNGLEAVARFCLTYAGHCRVVKPKKLREIVVESLKRGISVNIV